MSLIDYLNTIIEVKPELKSKLSDLVQLLDLKKGDLCIDINKPCDQLFFINEGLLRGYHFEDGKEITNWFALENEFATCFYSFITKQKSVEAIEAVENCHLSYITYNDLQSVYKEFPETERLGRIITENYYIKLEERLQNLKLKSAKERYWQLQKSNPNLLLRASLGQIAGYLGITQETVSRIRSES
ncbi:MAG: Crp/Fnr family transcriptional regulator [Bacteroidia bacterium]